MAHYYHFLFDLVMPFYCLQRNVHAETLFYIDDVDLASQRLQELFPDQIVVYGQERDPRIPTFPMVGLNPKVVDIPPDIIDEFVKFVWERLDCAYPSSRDKVLLVERLPPTQRFLKHRGDRRSGAERRAISNHAELANALGALTRPEFDFLNVHLETMPFKEQVEMFGRAQVLIAQHGAALANCLWMNKGSTIIEINSEPQADHFARASKLRAHNYYWYKTDSLFPDIDTDHFEKWVLSHPELKRYFGVGRSAGLEVP